MNLGDWMQALAAHVGLNPDKVSHARMDWDPGPGRGVRLTVEIPASVVAEVPVTEPKQQWDFTTAMAGLHHAVSRARGWNASVRGVYLDQRFVDAAIEAYPVSGLAGGTVLGIEVLGTYHAADETDPGYRLVIDA